MPASAVQVGLSRHVLRAQTFSRAFKIGAAGVVCLGLLGAILAAGGALSVLDLVNGLSYVKLSVTAGKYAPQVWDIRTAPRLGRRLGRCLGVISASSRRHLGVISASSRRHLVVISASSWRHPGVISASSRRNLA